MGCEICFLSVVLLACGDIALKCLEKRYHILIKSSTFKNNNTRSIIVLNTLSILIKIDNLEILIQTS